MLSRIQGRIVHKALDRVSPLAVPVMLEIGRETVYGEASEARAGRGGRGLDQGGDADDGRACVAAEPGQLRPRMAHSSRRRRATVVADRGRRALLAASRACSPSPICIWKKARALPRAACCCRPTTPRRRWRGWRALIARYAPRAVVALGDSFHDGGGPARLADTDRATLRRAAARPRLDLDRRQSRSRAGRRTSAGASCRRLSVGGADLPPRAERERRAARSPAICIRSRACRAAAARSAAAASPATARAW